MWGWTDVGLWIMDREPLSPTHVGMDRQVKGHDLPPQGVPVPHDRPVAAVGDRAVQIDPRVNARVYQNVDPSTACCHGSDVASGAVWRRRAGS